MAGTRIAMRRLCRLPQGRKGQGDTRLSHEEFDRRAPKVLQPAVWCRPAGDRSNRV